MRKITDAKLPIEYDNNVKEVFSLISYGKNKPQPVGSSSMRFSYGVDYDLFSVITFLI